jgi:hypothetical protein
MNWYWLMLCVFVGLACGIFTGIREWPKWAMFVLPIGILLPIWAVLLALGWL